MLDKRTIPRYVQGMLQEEDGFRYGRFIDDSADALEQTAISTLLGLMTSCNDPDVKLKAAQTALEVLGKDRPVQPQSPNNAPNIFLIANGAPAQNALTGLGSMVSLMRRAEAPEARVANGD